MAALSKKLRSLQGGCIGWWCPGCELFHAIPVTNASWDDGSNPNAARWTWDGSVEAPTFEPSQLTTHSFGANPLTAEKQVCHTFIRGGMIEFLNDSTHALSGKTVPIPDWPYAEGEFVGV